MALVCLGSVGLLDACGCAIADGVPRAVPPHGLQALAPEALQPLALHAHLLPPVTRHAAGVAGLYGGQCKATEAAVGQVLVHHLACRCA